MEELDYIDEIIVEYMAGRFDLEELDQAELDLVLDRLKEVAEVKLLSDFEIQPGTTIHIGSLNIH